MGRVVEFGGVGKLVIVVVVIFVLGYIFLLVYFYLGWVCVLFFVVYVCVEIRRLIEILELK